VHPGGAAAAIFDFEKGTGGWVGLYDDPTVVRTAGRRCLALKTNDTVNREYLSPFFAVRSDGRYKVSAWVKVERFDAGHSPLTINIRWYFRPEETCSHGGWNVFRAVREDFRRTFGWKRIERVVEVPANKNMMEGKITHARIQIRNYRTKGTAYVDDIRVERERE